MDWTIILLLSGWIIWLMTLIAFLRNVIKQTNPDGIIRVNTNDPEKDTYTLELGIPFGELDKRDKVIFKIEHE